MAVRTYIDSLYYKYIAFDRACQGPQFYLANLLKYTWINGYIVILCQ